MGGSPYEMPADRSLATAEEEFLLCPALTPEMLFIIEQHVLSAY